LQPALLKRAKAQDVKLPPALVRSLDNLLLQSFDIPSHFLKAHGAHNFDDFGPLS
jgi:hypothetical protein